MGEAALGRGDVIRLGEVARPFGEVALLGPGDIFLGGGLKRVVGLLSLSFLERGSGLVAFFESSSESESGGMTGNSGISGISLLI